ncbi:MAG: hypothetical protein R3Y52_00780 [Psittacicella sp.]
MYNNQNKQFHTIQNIISPSDRFPIDFGMYYRFDIFTRYSKIDDAIYTQKNGFIEFNTFYNSFSLGKFRKNTIIDNLTFSIKGEGKAAIQIFGRTHANIEYMLKECEIELSNEYTNIDISELLDSEYVIIYPKIKAITDLKLNQLCFRSTTKPKQAKLGIVITHFNRLKEITFSAQNIKENLLESPLYKDHIDLIIVDNSKNCGIKETQNIKVIPNLNYGGTGGFTRGLIELEDNGNYTHCLFMDDDGACEIESIKRIYNFFKYSKAEDTAISGMMLREDAPWMLHEKGGKFNDGNVYPILHGLNLVDVNSLIHIENEDDKIEYGAWFFFGFPIKHVSQYAFPFFVRGDDIHFSLLNKFNIISLSGVGVYSFDFAAKESGLTKYLNFRYNKMLSLTNGKNRIWFLKQFLKEYYKQVLSLNYGSAKMISFAMKGILSGPEYFEKNIDMQEIFKTFKTYCVGETKKPIDPNNGLGFPLIVRPEKRGFRLLRKITINGTLIPFFRKKLTVNHPNESIANFKGISRYKTVLYYERFSKTGYYAEQNFIRFSVAIIRSIGYSIKILFIYGSVQKKYKKEFSKYTNKSFWKKIYKK